MKIVVIGWAVFDLVADLQVVGVLFAAVIVAYLQVVVIVGVVFGPVADLQVVGVLFEAVIVADL